MSVVKVDMRPDYRREELGEGVRGKYLTRYKKGTNLVLLEGEVAEAFPTPQAVNEALKGLLQLTKKTNRLTSRTRRTQHKRVSEKK
jgi:hypothetical protein